MPKDPVGRYFRAQLLLHRGFDVDFDQHPEAVIRERLTRSFVNRLKISIFYGSINSVRHQRLLLGAKLDNSQAQCIHNHAERRQRHCSSREDR